MTEPLRDHGQEDGPPTEEYVREDATPVLDRMSDLYEHLKIRLQLYLRAHTNRTVTLSMEMAARRYCPQLDSETATAVYGAIVTTEYGVMALLRSDSAKAMMIAAAECRFESLETLVLLAATTTFFAAQKTPMTVDPLRACVAMARVLANGRGFTFVASESADFWSRPDAVQTLSTPRNIEMVTVQLDNFLKNEPDRYTRVVAAAEYVQQLVLKRSPAQMIMKAQANNFEEEIDSRLLLTAIMGFNYMQGSNPSLIELRALCRQAALRRRNPHPPLPDTSTIMPK